MDTTKIIKENLNSVVKGKHGKWLNKKCMDVELGSGVFQYNGFSNILTLYSQGVSYESKYDGHVRELKIKYCDIYSVNSFLTIEKYSEISRTGNYFQLIPMVLECYSGYLYELMVPLIIYSGVLVSLCECSNPQSRGQSH